MRLSGGGAEKEATMREMERRGNDMGERAKRILCERGRE